MDGCCISVGISTELIKSEARKIPGISDLEDSSPMTTTTFKKYASQAFNSKTQNPECRYFVEVLKDPKLDPPSSFLYSIMEYFYMGSKFMSKTSDRFVEVISPKLLKVQVKLIQKKYGTLAAGLSDSPQFRQFPKIG